MIIIQFVGTMIVLVSALTVLPYWLSRRVLKQMPGQTPAQLPAARVTRHPDWWELNDV